MADVLFSHVKKVFPDGTTAVHDLTLEIDDGELLVLVGPSGCGKTTVLRMVAGLLDVSAGEIRIGGRLVNDIDPSERDIAMVFQTYALYPHMTIGNRVAVMRRGGIVQIGDPQDIYDRPADLFIARFIGSPPMNLIEGKLTRDGGYAVSVGERIVPIDAEEAGDGAALDAYVGRP